MPPTRITTPLLNGMNPPAKSHGADPEDRQVEGEDEGGTLPSYESSMRNLAKARAVWRPPRPWRSSDEALMIRRYVFQWLTARGKKPSGRDWARQLGISHTWLQKLVRQFRESPNEMWRLLAANGDPDSRTSGRLGSPVGR